MIEFLKTGSYGLLQHYVLVILLVSLLPLY